MILDDESTVTLSVSWDEGTPLYDVNTAGTYIFTGILATKEGVANTDGLKAAVSVTVSPEVI